MKQNRFFQIVGLMLILAFFMSGLTFAQKSPKDKFDFPKLNDIKMPKIEEKTLKNGMKLFLVEDQNYPTINMRAMVRTGSVYEPAEKIGLAAITGSVLRTGGSKSMTGDEIDKKLETMAASIEGGIGSGSGFLSVSMLNENLDEVLSIFADIVMNPVFDKEKIELEKVQHRSGISRRNDEIGQITRREFFKLIYGANSPYARHAEYATIDAITRDDIIAYYKKFLHPNNIMMTVWGDFKTKNIVNKLEQAFADWKTKKLDIPPMPEVNYKFEYTVNFIDKPDVDQSNIMLGHIGGLKSNPDYAALSVMNRILSFDRMFKTIRTDEGLAYSVWGSYGTGYKVPGVFSAGAQTKSQSTVYAIELMIKEMERMMAEEVTDEELNRAKDKYLNTFVFQFDSKAKIVNRMMTLSYYGYPLDFNDKFIKQIENVTKTDILQVAKKYLQPDKVQILVVGKKEDFDKPLSSLGKVNVIDITIPEPKVEVPEATAETLEKGKKVFEKTIATLGGTDKISKIKNFSTTMSLTQVTPMGEMAMDGNMTIQHPDKMYMKLNTPGGEILMVINGDKGTMQHPGGKMPLPAQQRKDMMDNSKRDPIYIAQHLNDYKIQFIGKTKFGEADAIDILLIETDLTFHMYLNTETMLPLGTSHQGTTQQGPATIEQFDSDYKVVDGIKVPHKSIGFADGKKQSEVVIKEMKFNVELEEGLFKVE
ncbi:insulinase family protein [candidate division KSB1 bacterium]|nr:insulinase family protein [candidate division KSB1 bacterium]MBL7094062.1 insulinase family protein [candidate division KSB1 bacterium]